MSGVENEKSSSPSHPRSRYETHKTYFDRMTTGQVPEK